MHELKKILDWLIDHDNVESSFTRKQLGKRFKLNDNESREVWSHLIDHCFIYLNNCYHTGEGVIRYYKANNVLLECHFDKQRVKP